MKCKGASNKKICLECPYPECMANEYGVLPADMIDRLFREKYYLSYYREHKEEILARKKTEHGRQVSREAARRYRQKNAEKLRENARQYRREHREELKAKRKEYYRRTGK